MGIDGVETRMTDNVQAIGRNLLLEWIADGTVSHSHSAIGRNTIDREFDTFNCDLRPDHG